MTTLKGGHSLPADAKVAFYLDKARHYQRLAQGARADGVRDALAAVARDFVLRASGAREKKRA